MCNELRIVSKGQTQGCGTGMTYILWRFGPPCPEVYTCIIVGESVLVQYDAKKMGQMITDYRKVYFCCFVRCLNKSLSNFLFMGFASSKGDRDPILFPVA